MILSPMAYLILLLVILVVPNLLVLLRRYTDKEVRVPSHAMVFALSVLGIFTGIVYPYALGYALFYKKDKE